MLRTEGRGCTSRLPFRQDERRTQDLVFSDDVRHVTFHTIMTGLPELVLGTQRWGPLVPREDSGTVGI